MGDPRPSLIGAASPRPIGPGVPFHKVTGSGNDFVAFDQLLLEDEERPELLPTPDQVAALCHRRLGVGADGVMVLRGSGGADWRLLYYNADGSRAELCGNASLCSVRLAEALGRVGAGDVRFLTDAGLVQARIRSGEPEIDLAEIAPARADCPELRSDGLAAGELRLGFARVGVPHVVVRCGDTGEADLSGRGAALRHHPTLSDGANVNFVSRASDGWAIRTFERGVEAETLACGTGSVATAVLLTAWGETGGADDDSGVRLVMSTGLEHRVRLRPAQSGGWHPSLAGGARIVYRGELGVGAW